MNILGNIVFLGGKLLILAFLIFVWIWLFQTGDYITFILLTIFMAAGAVVGAKEAKAEMGA